MARLITEKDTFQKTCVITGREAEGRFNIVRKGAQTTRVIKVGTIGETEVVNTTLVVDEQVVAKPDKEPPETLNTVVEPTPVLKESEVEVLHPEPVTGVVESLPVATTDS